MQRGAFAAGAAVGIGLALSCGRLRAQGLPSDVRQGFWAAAPVQSALRNHLLTVEADHRFHGDSPVTHRQAVLALSRLAHVLEAGAWQGAAAAPIAMARTGAAPKKGVWESKSVSRYVFAAVLARIGAYVSTGFSRPKPGDKDFGKSTVLPAPAPVPVAKTSPAYDALTYLAERRMIWSGSALLAADDKPLTAAEMSRALFELMTGFTDRFTDLGHDEAGGTHDESFHARPPAGK